METYHKIQTVFLRDPETRFKTLLDGQWAKPEFDYLSSLPWVWTEKVDGTNIRVLLDEDGLRFAGKTDRAQLPGPLANRLVEMFQLEDMRELFGDGPVALYGEGYGPKIQAGGKYRQDQAFVLFDVLVNGIWLRRDDVHDVAVKLGLRDVPVVGVGTLPEMVEHVRAGLQSQWGDFEAEGIVARPAVELFNRRGERVITKLKAKDFRR